MIKSYHWKELSEDGLLKTVVHKRRFYSYEYLNNGGYGYNTEEEAVSDLKDFMEKMKSILVNTIL